MAGPTSIEHSLPERVIILGILIFLS